jgi:hypothetical protein
VIPDSLLKRLPAMPRLLRPAHPAVAVEITERSVTAARGSGEGLSSWFTSPILAGSVRSSAVQQNILDRDALAEQLVQVRDRLAPGGAEATLALPDSVLRVTVLAVDTLPRRRGELHDLVAWRLKKTLPYRVDEASLAWEVFDADGEGGKLVLAAAVRRRVLEEYESLLADAGLSVGSVTAASLGLSEWAPAVAGRDSLLLNVGRGWFAMLVTDGQRPLFYRSKPIPEGERGAGLREAFVASELFPTLEYYRRRLNGRGLGPLVLHAAGGGAANLEAALRAAVSDADDLFPAVEVTSPVPASVPEDLRARLGVVAGLAQKGWHRGADAALGGAA